MQSLPRGRAVPAPRTGLPCQDIHDAQPAAGWCQGLEGAEGWLLPGELRCHAAAKAQLGRGSVMLTPVIGESLGRAWGQQGLGVLALPQAPLGSPMGTAELRPLWPGMAAEHCGSRQGRPGKCPHLQGEWLLQPPVLPPATTILLSLHEG